MKRKRDKKERKIKMTRKNKTEINCRIFCPESLRDIEDIIEILQERETSILVNLSQHDLKRRIMTKIITFIKTSQKPYMKINVRRCTAKSFICWSKKIKE